MKFLDISWYFIPQAIFVQDTDCTDYKPIHEHHRFDLKNTDCKTMNQYLNHHRFSLKDLAGTRQSHNSETKSTFAYLIFFEVGQRIGASSTDDQTFNS